MKPRLLVLELWGLGDLAIATPFLQAAAAKYEVTLLAQPFAAELQARFWPAVEVIPLTLPWTAFHHKYRLWRWPWRELFRVRRELLARQFDHAVSARWDPRDHLLLRLTGARERLGFPRVNSQMFLTRPLIRPAPSAHRHEAWRVAGRALGLDWPASSERCSQPLSVNQPPSPRPSPRSGGEREVGTEPAAGRPPTVLVHTGAKVPVRVWPLERYREIIRRLRQDGFTVQVACDPNQLIWWQSRGENAACPATVTKLLELVDHAGVFIGNDSGPGHLAAACGRPTFTLFGPQLPEWFAPLHPASETMQGKACPYKPCSDYCRFAEPFCLRDVPVEEVWPKVVDFVRRNLRLET